MKRLTIIATIVAIGMLSGCDSELRTDEPADPPSPRDEAEAEFAALLEEASRSTETWRCYKHSADLFSIPAVRLTSNHMWGAGSVQLNGLPEQVTEFRIDGVDRRWNWGARDDGRFKYSFIISPDGVGTSYNFFEGETSTKPSNFFHECRKDRKASA